MTEVLIYTTPTCVFCRMAKQYFDENKVKYKEIDVTKSDKLRKEAIEKSGQMGVPVIDIDGEVVVGFDHPRIERILKKKGMKK